MKKIFLLAVVTLSLGACSTIEGVGEDLSGASRAVQRSM